MPELIADTPRRVLAVYAHPDDADVSCGGSLAAWAARGCEVQLLVCTMGEKGSRDPHTDPVELSAQRSLECVAAAAALGIPPPARLEYPDGELEDSPHLRSTLVGWVRRFRPDTVLCPDPTAVFFAGEYYNHRDHRILGFACLDSVSPAASSPLYFPETGLAHQVENVLLSGTLEPDVWVDITDVLEAKVAAVSCHVSQFPEGTEWVEDAVRQRASADGQRCGVTSAESFRRLRLGG